MINFKVTNRTKSESDGAAAQYQVTLMEVGRTPARASQGPNGITAGSERVSLQFSTGDSERGELFAPGKTFDLVESDSKASTTAK